MSAADPDKPSTKRLETSVGYGRDAGLRIDHPLISPPVATRLKAAGVDKAFRGREKASDHAPTWVELSDAK